MFKALNPTTEQETERILSNDINSTHQAHTVSQINKKKTSVKRRLDQMMEIEKNPKQEKDRT